MDQNQITFEVVGLGKFTTLKEETASMFFMDRRKLIAEMFGGMTELVKIETHIRAGMNSEDQFKKQYSAALVDELMRAQEIINFKSMVINTPAGFDIQKLNPAQLDSLIVEFQKARGLFRDDKSESGEQPSPPPPAQ